MEKERAKEIHDFISEQLTKYQHEEPQAVQRVKTAETNLEKAKKELADSKENLAGIRGGINVFVSELQRLEKVIKSE